MKTVTLTIDGKQVEAKEGMSLLEAAREAGVKIPTLCHDAKLKPYGACRMCLVEVVKGRRKRLVASCVHPVQEGLVVTTTTPRIQEIRKLIVELLWPAWTELGKEYGLTSSRFEPELTDCSLCGKCVRYCSEVAHKNAVYFRGRGVDRRVAFVPGMADECDSCRQCFGMCRSGWVITERGKDNESLWH